LVGIDSYIACQRIPALGTSRVARWIAAIPPDEKLVRVYWKRWLLKAVELFQAIQDFVETKL